jgi:hypothetical protein
MDTLRGVVGLWNLGMMLAALATLLWFVYWVFLRKFLRARRIANLRLRRIMDERTSSVMGDDRYRE